MEPAVDGPHDPIEQGNQRLTKCVESNKLPSEMAMWTLDRVRIASWPTYLT